MFCFPMKSSLNNAFPVVYLQESLKLGVDLNDVKTPCSPTVLTRVIALDHN